MRRNQVVLPNTPVQHGQAIQIGDVTFRMHQYGKAHTPWKSRKLRSKSKNTHRVGRVRIQVYLRTRQAHQAALFVCRIARLNKSTGIKPTSTKAKLGKAASPSLSSLAN